MCSLIKFQLKIVLFLLVYTIIIIFITTGVNNHLKLNKILENYKKWKNKCPVKDNIIITYEELHGRLGSHIWGYLSVWAVAKHYDMWPVMPKVTIDILNQYFDDLSISSLEEVSEKCKLQWLEEKFMTTKPVASLGHLLERIEHAGRNISLVKLSYLVVHTEEVLTRWRELHKQLKFKPQFTQAAQNKLWQIRENYYQNNVTDKMTEDLEFVGVHVRRTDFLAMYADIYPNAEPPEHTFYLNAIQWMRDHLKPRPLVFIITSDDLVWCHQYLNTSLDIVIAGSGDVSSPGDDLALLGSCNHTILAHGTFGLSAAMFARGRYTLLYDPRHDLNTKEMEFMPNLPGWYALDNQGKSHYKPGEQIFKMPYRNGNTTNGFWYTY